MAENTDKNTNKENRFTWTRDNIRVLKRADQKPNSGKDKK